METLNAKCILEAWRKHPLNCLDKYGSDLNTRHKIFNPESEQEKARNACEWMHSQWHEIGEYIETCDYLWSLNPHAYELGAEAYLQARAIQQLSCLWNITLKARRTFPPSNKVVVRQSFTTSYDFMSPRYKPFEGIKFVVIPHAYFDFSILIWQGFEYWAQQATGIEASWDAVTHDVIPLDYKPEHDPYLLEVVARQLAVPARDFDVELPDAADAIAHAVPFFQGAIGLVPQERLSPFVAQTNYVLTDFALAHEMGHRLSADDTSSQENTEKYLAAELEADRLGMDLFRASWGWRAEILEKAPLDDAGCIAFGPVVFFHTSRLRGELASNVLRRIKSMKKTPDKGKELGWSDVDEARAQRLSTWTIQYLQSLRAQGANVSDDALRRLSNLASNLFTYGDYLKQRIAAIPKDDLVTASKVANHLKRMSL